MAWHGSGRRGAAGVLAPHPEDVVSPSALTQRSSHHHPHHATDGESTFDGSEHQHGMDRRQSEGSGEWEGLGLGRSFDLRRLTRNLTHMLRSRAHTPVYAFDDRVEHDMT